MGIETLAAGAFGAQLIGGAASAASTLAGGNYAKSAGAMQKQAAEVTARQIEAKGAYEAGQTEVNAAQALASAQRKAFDAKEQARLAGSTLRARAGASGVDAGVGSPAEAAGQLAARGEYETLMNLYAGQSAQTGLLNEAAAQRYSTKVAAQSTRFGGDVAEWEGQAKAKASKLAALGTLAGAAGAGFGSYYNISSPSKTGAVKF